MNNDQIEQWAKVLYETKQASAIARLGGDASELHLWRSSWAFLSAPSQADWIAAANVVVQLAQEAVRSRVTDEWHDICEEARCLIVEGQKGLFLTEAQLVRLGTLLGA